MVQDGGDLNITLVGGSWWAIGGGENGTDYASPHGVGPDFSGVARDSVVVLGHTVDNWSPTPMDPARPDDGLCSTESVLVNDMRALAGASVELARIAASLDKFTRLVLADLAVNFGLTGGPPTTRTTATGGR